MRKIFIDTAIVMVAFAFLQYSENHRTSKNISNNIGYQQAPTKDKGIGPFKNVTLAPIDKEKVKNGLSLFNNKCALCHEIGKDKVGPSLRIDLKDDSPEFILNMIVNPVEMEKSNANIKELMKEFNNVPMPNQRISQEDALDIFEFLRSVAKNDI